MNKPTKTITVPDPLCVESIEYRGYTVHISYDTEPYNPWIEYDGEPPVIAVGSFDTFHAPKYLDILDGAFADIERHAIIDTAEHIAIENGWTHYGRRRISGDVQRDYGEVIAIATPEWIKATGAPEDSHARQCKDACQQFEDYIFGRVYCYEIEGLESYDGGTQYGYIGSDHDASGLTASYQETIDAELKDNE